SSATRSSALRILRGRVGAEEILMNRTMGWAGAILVAIGAAGCGGGDGEAAAAAASGTSSGSGGAASGAPTFYEDIAPIVYERCLSCHVEGGIAPFSLASYENAKTAAGSIQI